MELAGAHIAERKIRNKLTWSALERRADGRESPGCDRRQRGCECQCKSQNRRARAPA